MVRSQSMLLNDVLRQSDVGAIMRNPRKLKSHISMDESRKHPPVEYTQEQHLTSDHTKRIASGVLAMFLFKRYDDSHSL